jgi:hypothetical protein
MSEQLTIDDAIETYRRTRGHGTIGVKWEKM